VFFVVLVKEEVRSLTINPTQQKVVEAASLLFFQKGFHGTSVRDIAEKASVNVSLISYYFKSKQGLLEYAVTSYYEMYFDEIEKMLRKTESETPLEKLKRLTATIINYRQEHFQLTSFIQRELSLDSIFVREVSVTYLAKENHILSKLFFDVIKDDSDLFKKRSFVLMQFKGMLMTPYTMQNDWKDQLSDEYSHQYFANNYIEIIHNWLNYLDASSVKSTN